MRCRRRPGVCPRTAPPGSIARVLQPSPCNSSRLALPRSPPLHCSHLVVPLGSPILLVPPNPERCERELMLGRPQLGVPDRIVRMSRHRTVSWRLGSATRHPQGHAMPQRLPVLFALAATLVISSACTGFRFGAALVTVPLPNAMQSCAVYPAGVSVYEFQDLVGIAAQRANSADRSRLCGRPCR